MFASIIANVTMRELEASQARVRELERLCDGLTHMIVHDLRSPLTSMLASVKTVIQLGDTLTDERKGRLLQLALRGGDALVGMIDDLLDVHRLEAGGTVLQRAPGDLAATISRACQQIAALAERGGVDILVERSDAIGQPSFDAAKIERVLVNLLGNAVQATDSNGKVTVSVARAGDAISITVADTGIGIAPEHLGRIFEKFYRVDGSNTEHASSGLGLTFCKLMIEAHGGTIEATSTLGAGTRIAFTLPG